MGNGIEHEVNAFNSLTYLYINDERLKQVNDNYFLYYDALGRCVKRTLNGATTYYIYDEERDPGIWPKQRDSEECVW